MAYKKYRDALLDKYGEEAVLRLEKLAQNFPNSTHRFTKQELLDIIHDSQVQVQWYVDKAIANG